MISRAELIAELEALYKRAAIDQKDPHILATCDLIDVVRSELAKGLIWDLHKHVQPYVNGRESATRFWVMIHGYGIQDTP